MQISSPATSINFYSLLHIPLDFRNYSHLFTFAVHLLSFVVIARYIPGLQDGKVSQYSLHCTENRMELEHKALGNDLFALE